MSAQPALPMESIVPPWNCDAAAQVVAPRMATLHAATCAMPGCACPSLRSSPETVMRQTYRIERYAPKMARHTASSALATYGSLTEKKSTEFCGTAAASLAKAPGVATPTATISAATVAEDTRTSRTTF